MDMKAKNILHYSFWAVVAVVLVYFCLRSVDWTQFGEALRHCRWEYVLLAMLFGVLGLIVRGLRWRRLLLPLDASTSAVTSINAYGIGNAVNLVVPRAGDVVRVGYVINRSAQDQEGRRLVGFNKGLGTVVMDRGLDVVLAIIIAVVLMFVEREHFGSWLMGSFSGADSKSNIWWLLIGVLAFLVGIIILLWALRKKGGMWSKVWQFIAGIGHGIASIRHMHKSWLFVLDTILIWIFLWGTSASIVWALQDIEQFASLTLADTFLIMIIGCITTAIPVPGGFGAYHGIVAGALVGIWGIPLSLAMIYATLNHESQVVVNAVCGIVTYIHESFIRKP